MWKGPEMVGKTEELPHWFWKMSDAREGGGDTLPKNSGGRDAPEGKDGDDNEEE